MWMIQIFVICCVMSLAMGVPDPPATSQPPNQPGATDLTNQPQASTNNPNNQLSTAPKKGGTCALHESAPGFVKMLLLLISLMKMLL